MWRITDMNESRHTVAPRCAWYTHVWMSHVTCANEARHRYEWVIWVMSPGFASWSCCDWYTCISMSHVTCANEAHPSASNWYRPLLQIYVGLFCGFIGLFCGIGTHVYQGVMPHMRMSHVTDMSESCRIHEWVTLYIWISHGMYANASCHRYQLVMSCIRMNLATYISHFICTNVARHRYEWVTAYGCASLRLVHTCINESCHMHEWVTSCKWMSHVTCMNESRHIYKSVMAPMQMRHATYINESCHKYDSSCMILSCMCDMTHSDV